MLAPPENLRSHLPLKVVAPTKKKVLRAIGNFLRFTLVLELYTVFSLTYIYDYIIKLCWQQGNVQNHVRNIGQGEARRGKYKRLKLCGGQAYRPFK
jgi:hypothetical protein